MPIPKKPEPIRKRLKALLENFEEELRRDDLRQKVLALVPILYQFRNLGVSLVACEDESSGRDRILYYFRRYPRIIISGDEILIVSGIQEYARRVRELRIQYGWSIVSGVTAKEMARDNVLTLDGVRFDRMKTDDYLLLSEEQDREAAHRWNLANEIRKRDGSVRDRILDYMKENVGRPITGEELRYVAREKTEWARRVRELRTEFGWPIQTKVNGRPDLPPGTYILESLRQSPVHDRRIPDSIRGEVLRRDQYRCANCGWSHADWNTSDPRHLELHHRIQHARGGENDESNLVTLCTICHDRIHAETQVH